jgi:hypothetical protein
MHHNYINALVTCSLCLLTVISVTSTDPASPSSRPLRSFLDEEGLRGEEREHSVAQLEHQVLHLKRKVLEDALARRTSRSPSQASGRGGGAGGLGTTSMLSDFGM